MSERIGVIGLGIMGGAISANFIEAGFSVTGYDVDPARTAELATRGGGVTSSPGEVARASDIVLTSLPSTDALDAVVNAADGIVAAAATGVIVMECSTFPIEDKQRNHEDKRRNHDALAAAGVTMLDTPLSSTGAQAVNRDLSVYLSGDEVAAERCKAIVPGFARAIVRAHEEAPAMRAWAGDWGCNHPFAGAAAEVVSVIRTAAEGGSPA